MDDIFSMIDNIIATSINQMDEIMRHVDAEIDDIKKKVDRGEIKVRNFIVKNGKLVELPMVPTTDRISFTKKPSKTTNIAPESANTHKRPNIKPSNKSKFTSLEEKKIRNLREKGWSIKSIARDMRRDDKAVSAFVRSAGI